MICGRVLAPVRMLAVAEHGPLDDQLEVMLSLMEAYEARHHRINNDQVTPLNRLNLLLEQHEMTASELGRLLGDRSLGNKILSGKRKLSLRHIKILCDHFQISADLLLN